MFANASNVTIHGGTFISTTSTQTSSTPRGMELLLKWIATDAFYDSDELDNVPKCDPHTCAVLDDIIQWVGESEPARDDFILWLFGPAGAGKTVLAKRIAAIAAEKNFLIATFFFSRSSLSRGTKDRLIPTLAYQLALSIPETRTHIEHAIERDPAIFRKNIRTQIDILLIKPFQAMSAQIIVPKLIIIDSLDECKDSRAQVAILDAISHSFRKHNLPMMFLVVSRPELILVTSFNRDEPLKSIHRRLLLGNTYQEDFLRRQTPFFFKYHSGFPTLLFKFLS